MASRYLLGKRGRLGERERVHAGCTVTHTHTQAITNRQEGRMSADLTHLFSLALSVFPTVL